MLTSRLMVNGAGVDKLAPEIQGLADPTTFLFVTSPFPGVVAFHNGVARYLYVAGREGLLPRALGVTHPVFQSPHAGSLVQMAIAVAVVTLFAFTGQDPVLALFSYIATNFGAADRRGGRACRVPAGPGADRHDHPPPVRPAPEGGRCRRLRPARRSPGSVRTGVAPRRHPSLEGSLCRKRSRRSATLPSLRRRCS